MNAGQEQTWGILGTLGGDGQATLEQSLDEGEEPASRGWSVGERSIPMQVLHARAGGMEQLGAGGGLGVGRKGCRCLPQVRGGQRFPGERCEVLLFICDRTSLEIRYREGDRLDHVLIQA